MAKATHDDAGKEKAGSSLDLHYGHPRMPLSERAKIFIPFDPLEGFRAALQEEERKARERE